MTTTGHNGYSPLINDCSSQEPLDGLTPVGTAKSEPALILPNGGVNGTVTGINGVVKSVEKHMNGGHTHINIESVDTVTQTAHASIVTLPRLHIPGETGELAGLSSEDARDLETPEAVAVTPEKLKKIYAQIKAKKYKYKLIFFTSVVCMLLIAYSSVLFPWFIPYFHSIVFPCLYILRWVMYTKSHWQLYCLDFCYFVNIALLVFVWAFPRVEAFFAVVFGATAGPVATAVFVFRNSVVYHDYDRMTSAYIHLLPNLVIYILRWYPDATSVNWYFHPAHKFSDISMYTNQTELTTDYLPQWVDARWLWILAIPLIWFLMHTILYMIVENCCFKNKKYLTSYKWLTSNEKSVIYTLLTLNGRITKQSKVKLSWVLFNILYGVVGVFISRLCYEYQTAHTVLLILLHVVAIYNGASFYIDVFAKRGLGVANG